MRRRHPALARLLAQPAAAVSLGFLIAEVVLVLLLPLVLGQDPNVTDRAAGFWAAPGGAHLLGTDDVGRDLFARLLAGGRVSLLVGYAAAGLSTVLGVPLGVYAATHQYQVGDYVASFIGFVGLAVPNFLLALVLLYVGKELLVLAGSLFVFRRKKVVVKSNFFGKLAVCVFYAAIGALILLRQFASAETTAAATPVICVATDSPMSSASPTAGRSANAGTCCPASIATASRPRISSCDRPRRASR